MSRAPITIDHIHCSAICEEIGYRLRIVLSREHSELPIRLQSLLDRFQQLERHEAPSIVPSIRELMTHNGARVDSRSTPKDCGLNQARDHSELGKSLGDHSEHVR
jgi:hypothetical protein